MKSSSDRLSERVPILPDGPAVALSPALSRRTASPSSALLRHHTAPRCGEEKVPDVEIVIPVLDGERMLAASVRRLHSFLWAGLPFSWRIIIADKASTDRTPIIAARLSDELPGVRVLRLEARGRGRALRAARSVSDARVVSYMDADLSTDLKGLLPLVAPLLSGHSDLAIGTRLSRGARVARAIKREFISRSYNRLLWLALRARFSDAQCGFKAVRSDVVGELLPGVRDQAWFFDTELLILAQRRGLRIHEVLVDWVEGPESSADIIATALADLRGVVRLAAATPIARFVAVGIVSTAAYALLLMPLGLVLANAVALAITTIGNTPANGALAVLHGLDPRGPPELKLVVLIAATLAATATRYVALSTWVFSRDRRAASEASNHTSLSNVTR